MLKNFEDIFIRFDVIHERDRQTDRQSDGHRVTANTALMHMHRAVKIIVTTRHVSSPHNQLCRDVYVCWTRVIKLLVGLRSFYPV